MKRRDFIKKAGLTAAATFAAPYILPSGSLFAATGARKAQHVVVCLYAGGVRSLESHKHANGQFGNMMPYTFTGNPIPLAGVDAGNILGTPSGPTLQEQGTLFNEFKMKEGPTGHYNGHATLITGQYTDTSLNINSNPQYPTLFELYRKHNSPSMSALNAWWVSNSLGPYPQLNYSSYPGYGSLYGANHIQPISFLDAGFESVYTEIDPFSGNNEAAIKAKLSHMRDFCDSNFNMEFSSSSGIMNTAEDKIILDQFIQDSFYKAGTGQYNDPWGLGGGYNGDMYNIFFAEKIIQEFQPELLVVNMQNVDVGHDYATGYLNNMLKADYALWHLWETIKSTPGMEDTILIAVPEHGRNQEGNGIIDAYGREAHDHTNDAMSRDVFCLLLSHQASTPVYSNNIITANTGEVIDIVPTVANILGFDNDIPTGLLNGRVLTEAFM
jgi:hypothetical protein